MRNQKAIILLVFFMLLGIGFLAYYYYEYKQHPRRLPTYGNPGHHVLPFSFTNQDGKPLPKKMWQGKFMWSNIFSRPVKASARK
jgi:cytochrome oxidase Cu insertion factor (SCO1/SenC/PrrC family)